MNGTRDTIIETAFLLFLKKDSRRLRLPTWRRPEGDDERTFYYHFLNKEEVLKEGGDEVLPYVEEPTGRGDEPGTFVAGVC